MAKLRFKRRKKAENLYNRNRTSGGKSLHFRQALAFAYISGVSCETIIRACMGLCKTAVNMLTWYVLQPSMLLIPMFKKLKMIARSSEGCSLMQVQEC